MSDATSLEPSAATPAAAAIEPVCTQSSEADLLTQSMVSLSVAGEAPTSIEPPTATEETADAEPSPHGDADIAAKVGFLATMTDDEAKAKADKELDGRIWRLRLPSKATLLALAADGKGSAGTKKNSIHAIMKRHFIAFFRSGWRVRVDGPHRCGDGVSNRVGAS